MTHAESLFKIVKETTKTDQLAIAFLMQFDRRKYRLVDRIVSALSKLEKDDRIAKAIFVDLRFGFVIRRKVQNSPVWAFGPTADGG